MRTHLLAGRTAVLQWYMGRHIRDVLRWAVMPFACALGAVGASMAVKWLNLATARRYDVDTSGPVFGLMVEIQASMLLGAAWVYIAYKVSPHHKVSAAWVMLAAFILLSGGLIAFDAMQREFAAIVHNAIALLGAGGVAIDLYVKHGFHSERASAASA